MMHAPLFLDSLHIRGFRGLRDLQIDRLGRVNLFVGKNNVGKSSVLEALWLYAYRFHPTAVREVLNARDEGTIHWRIPPGPSRANESRFLDEIRHLFHGRANLDKSDVSIRIGPTAPESRILSASMIWYAVGTDEEGRREIKRFPASERELVDDSARALAVEMGQEFSILHRFNRTTSDPAEGQSVPCVFTRANGLDAGEIALLWDKISLTNEEADVFNALRIIAPEVERVSLVSIEERTRERKAIVRVLGLQEPIPLRSLGDGMNRLFGVALALVNSKGGMTLIDEADSGLHYSVQTDVWRLIFEAAARLDTQVFATTHSWDCIEAFQKAAEENQQEEGLLIRLERKKGDVVATEFDERRLGIATREEIEVR